MTVPAILPLSGSYAERRDAVFLPVAGVSPLVRIVGGLARAGEVVVAAAAPLADDVRNALAGQSLAGVRVVAVEPPGTRAQCIAAGLAGLPRGPVLLHDLAWPLFADATVESVVAAVRGGAPVVWPTRPVTDSVKVVDERGTVTATLDRSALRTVQYPRGFDSAVLGRLLAGDVDGSFDELSAVLAHGTAPTLVDGDTDTMRFELPADAAFLAALIEGRRHRPH
ncbi:2-C-methyl-D-erythritol 4-phosphate cytidylyltransferase [Mycobacterium sp. ITM-2016-00317]|uniref:IspD/TarI family cytidylyltransferase n=1 Tax=Mycobacterium sp. ITM-2016-00317 TaxID=2099694 RepID=UPI000D4ED021|nr:2-C-methyl-D-erythritol 4-phosphate cytidylyltransferase [Mycobacterium sp. ITM-2016-00317]WNG85970.1 2-C-methyl-D-erythritol 4-phosphate cytidylyltransferase [Mycobacterium sp. ITM-2016-00317]